MFWKTQIISLLRNKSIEKCLLKEFMRHSPSKDTSIVLDALRNYFSSNNPGFEHNWFTFDDGCTLTISREGIYFSAPSDAKEEVKEDAEYSQWIICEKVTKNTWLRTFIGKYPDVDDDPNDEEDYHDKTCENKGPNGN